MAVMFWILLCCYYIVYQYKKEQRIIEDKAFWSWQPEICDIYYHQPEPVVKYEHKYYTRSKARTMAR